MEKELCEMWDKMTMYGVATDEEIGLAIALCGRTIETLKSVLYIRTGYRDIDQFLEEWFWE